MKHCFRSFLLIVFAASSISNTFAHSEKVLWQADSFDANEKYAPIDKLISEYTTLTSAQQQAQNKKMLAERKSWRVQDECSIMDVRESVYFAQRQTPGWEVDCRRDKPNLTITTLFFPVEAGDALLALRKGTAVKFLANAVSVQAFGPSAVAEGYATGLYLSAQGAPRIPAVVGKDIKSARRLLLAAGWQPKEMISKVRAHHSGQEHDLYSMGIREIERCAGTGVQPCTYNYTKEGQCLRVVTLGEFSKGDDEKFLPRVDNVQRACVDAE